MAVGIAVAAGNDVGADSVAAVGVAVVVAVAVAGSWANGSGVAVVVGSGVEAAVWPKVGVPAGVMLMDDADSAGPTVGLDIGAVSGSAAGLTLPGAAGGGVEVGVGETVGVGKPSASGAAAVSGSGVGLAVGSAAGGSASGGYVALGGDVAARDSSAAAQYA